MALVEDDDVLQKLSAKATVHALNIGILPRRSRRGDDLIDTETFNPSPNALTVNTIAVSQ